MHRWMLKNAKETEWKSEEASTELRSSFQETEGLTAIKREAQMGQKVRDGVFVSVSEVTVTQQRHSAETLCWMKQRGRHQHTFTVLLRLLAVRLLLHRLLYIQLV